MMSLFQSVSRRGFPVRSFATRTSSFPSLIIRPNELLAKGSFAEAQAEFLCPDEDTVEQLDTLLHNNNVGVVAHFYMDPELQGVLQAVSWPHVFIADSLAMGDAAVKMAKSGVKAITVLGVDFMSENVQATLRAEGYDTPVYRLSEQHIGCSLAESAEGTAYAAYLEQASKVPNSLHVVYINTSFNTKANAQNRIPKITCT
jgi:quinolinate synthase